LPRAEGHVDIEPLRPRGRAKVPAALAHRAATAALVDHHGVNRFAVIDGGDRQIALGTELRADRGEVGRADLSHRGFGTPRRPRLSSERMSRLTDWLAPPSPVR
jgi:hypothetical protein